MKKFLVFILFLSTVITGSHSKEIQLYSPDKTVKVEISSYPQLKYKVQMDETTITEWSELSLSLNDGTVIGQNTRVTSTKTSSNKQEIPALFYRREIVTDHFNQLTIQYSGGWGVEFRAYNDGIAYRFIRTGKKAVKIKWEQAEYNFPGDYPAYVPYVRFEKGIRRTIEEQLNTSFESIYNYEKLSELDSERLILTPAVVEFPDGKKACLAEADLENYPGMFLYNPDGKTSLRSFFAHYPKTEKQGGHNMLQNLVTSREEYIATIESARTFPWRTILLAREDKELPVNDMVYRLASPSRIKDTFWIKPGKVAWEWWNNWGIYGVDFKAGINTETYKHYIDFANEYGIEYIIIDEGWSVHAEADMMQVIPEINLPEIVAYGNSKNIGIILWGGFRAFNRDMENICRHYAEMGVKGFKIDFIDRDDQAAVNFVYRAAETTAKYKLLLDLHGIYKPTGLNRTYPNVLTFEGVHGLETCKWTPMETADPVVYEVTMPFLRMVAGAVDYTQGAMDNRTRKSFRDIYDEPMSPGTRCRQLAQYIVFESPLSMLCDSPNKYRQEEECTHFITSLPVTWDETIVLDGKIGSHIVTARRSGETWYIGGMTNWNPRTVSIDLPLSKDGEYEIELFRDGINADRSPRDYKREIIPYKKGNKLVIEMAPGGGFAGVVRKKAVSYSHNPPIPPYWSLGHIVWEDSINTSYAATDLVNRYLSRDIPVNGIIIDSPWSTAYNDFNWDPERYPDYREMISHFKSKDVKVLLWLTGAINTSSKDTPQQKSSNYEEAKKYNYSVNDNQESKWWKGTGIHLDFTNKEAKEWWHKQLDKVFMDGVYGWKVDQAEMFFGDSVKTSAGNISNREFRHYYYDGMFDYTLSRNPAGITIARPYSHQGGFAGSINKTTIGWCGDFAGDWNGLKLQINNIYQSAIKGYGALSCEIAGFYRERSDKAQFIRYTQFAAMTATMINGGENGAFTNHLPWYHGEDAEQIYRFCVTLHNQLKPYIFSNMVENHLQGGALLKNCSLEEESHCLGNSIFTKAITSEKKEVTYTLPPDGEWIDFWSGKTVTGSQSTTQDYPLDKFPLYFRKGAIIPLHIENAITGIGDNSMTGKEVLLIYADKKKTSLTYHCPIGEGIEYEDVAILYDGEKGNLTIESKKDREYVIILRQVENVNEVKGCDSWHYNSLNKKLQISTSGKTIELTLID